MTADFGSIGHYEGKIELTKFFRDAILSSFPFFTHMFHNPIVEVKGEKAAGQWYFEVDVRMLRQTELYG